MALSVVTLNANGLRDQSKRAGLLQWFRSLIVVPDIVCLQECHLTWNVRLGLGPLVICVPSLQGQRMPVAVLFYFGQLCLLYILALNQTEDF